MANSEPVHFFDITSKHSGSWKSWSPNTLKTRMVLNYKGIHYTQSFISYPDIAVLLKGLSVPPIPEEIAYTLPAIIHKTSITSNHSGAMNDSLPIALHLEETFPAPRYPSIFPSEDASYALALAVEGILNSAITKGYVLVLPNIADILDDRGNAYFHETRSKRLGPLAELRPKTEEGVHAVWNDMKKELAKLPEMLKGKKGKNGPFLEGEKPGYADFEVVSWLAWFERSDKETFEMLMSFGEGTLKALWDASLPWVNGQGEEREWALASL